jgi:6-phosphogluconolactonase
LPVNFSGVNSTAEVQFHPNGRFVYGSNRGHDSLAIFAFDAKTGKLTTVGHVKTGGETPRNFRFSPDGRWLIAANQSTDNLVVFKVGDDGVPVATGAEARVSKPVCVKFAK